MSNSSPLLSSTRELTCDSSMADSEDKKDSTAFYSNGPTYDFPSFSNLLRSVLTANSPLFRFQGQHEKSQMDHVGVIKPKATRVQLKVQSECANPSANAPSGISKEHPETALPNPPVMIHKDMPRLVSPQEKSDHNNTTPSHVVKEQPATDGYSWRKYGQKQVKSSKSSRSYYRCAHFSCHAKKKVQHCDQSGQVIDIVYMGNHNHEIIQNNRIVTRAPASASKLAAGTQVDSIQKVDGTDPCIHSEDSGQSLVQMGGTEQHSSTNGKFEGHNGDMPESEKLFIDLEAQQKHGSEPGVRKRLKETSVHSTSVSVTNKEPKTVVHMSVDGVTSNDGYRWRKYGQKMVKGNSHSRSYYRCTSAGCTAHKHVERVTNDATAIIITYVGKHDHDMPVPKKQKVSKSLARVPSAVAMGNDDAHYESMERLSSRPTTTKQPMEVEGDVMDEKVLELGGKEALESARTLLTFSALESNRG